MNDHLPDLNDLKTMDLDSLKSFFPDHVLAPDVRAGLDGDRLHIQQISKRQMITTMRRASAMTTLPRLPAAGETFHIVCAGNWSSFDLLATAVALTRASITHLCIATLGFSKANAEELVQMLDTGVVEKLDMVISCFFRSHERGLTDRLSAEIRQRGQRFASIRNHSKLIAMRFETGQHIVIETSANLRSCRNIEQFNISDDPELYAFHTTWINDLIKQGDQK